MNEGKQQVDLNALAMMSSSYINTLLGTDLPKKLQELAQIVQKGVNDPSELIKYISLVSDAQMKLTKTNDLQLNTLGRLLGWIHNYLSILQYTYEIKRKLRDLLRDVEAVSIGKMPQYVEEEYDRSRRELEKTIDDVSKLLFRIINDFMFWVNALPSKDGTVFDKLTSRTIIQHQFAQNVEERGKRWFW